MQRWGHYLSLWARVTRYGGLPGPGGMDDQEERLMRILDVVSEEMDRAEEERRPATPSLVVPHGRVR